MSAAKVFSDQRTLHDDAEEGLAYLVPVDHIIAAALCGALSVLAGFGWWLHHTFIVPSRPRRTT